jgi:cytochrome c553
MVRTLVVTVQYHLGRYLIPNPYRVAKIAGIHIGYTIQTEGRSTDEPFMSFEFAAHRICAATAACVALTGLFTPYGARPLNAPTQREFTRPSAYFPAGDPERGRTLALQCEACHVDSAPAVGDPPVHAPRLRHQRASAIFYALQDYKTRRRDSAVMRTIAAPLDDQQMRDLAVYLAGERTPIPKPALTAAHDRSAAVCGFCHGETGLGEMDGYPVLAGQHLDYLEKALADYRSGSRSDPTMSAIVKRISPREARELAEYFSAYSALESIP